MKKIILIGNRQLQGYADGLKKLGYDVSILTCEEGVHMLQSNVSIDGVIVPTFIQHHNELSRERTHDGLQAGPVLVEMFWNKRPGTTFFLLGGQRQRIVCEGPNVVFLANFAVLGTPELVACVEDTFASYVR